MHLLYAVGYSRIDTKGDPVSRFMDRLDAFDLCGPKIPVELPRDASFRDLRKLLGRWMEVPPDNVKGTHSQPLFNLLIDR